MSDALPLPSQPDLEQYKKLARDFQRACKSDDAAALRNWANSWLSTLARLQGLELTLEVRERINFEAQRMEHRWLKLKQTNERLENCLLTDAQFFIAREHGFASWPKFAQHIEALLSGGSPVSQFETAVDAIISGDLTRLEKLLLDNPDLIRVRSTRDHRSTLLHYISANGVEDFRQKTPRNIVAITKLLLDAGADVNAESDAYGGRSTALGLTATSCHPADAGVQLDLLELLIERGARIDGPDGGSEVNGCLHNGRGEAAEFLAKRGARLDLEGAAGVGRLEVVKSFFNDDGSLRPPATQQQLKDGFAWACEFGRAQVVEFLLQKGIKIDERLRHDGETGLHWAGYEGHADIVKLLLKNGAPVDVRDKSYGGTPLEWTLYGWANTSENHRAVKNYYEVVAQLLRAGAKLEREWYDENGNRRRTILRINADARMQAALRGESAEGT